MGKMGEAANLGAVAIAAFIVLKLSGMKLPSFELPKFVLPSIEIQQIQEYRDTSQRLRDELAEHSANLENIIARDPFPTIPPLDIQPVEYYESKLEYHRARLEHSEQVSEVLVPGIEAQLGALQLNLGELQSIVPGSNADIDAGGSTDMVTWGARRNAVR